MNYSKVSNFDNQSVFSQKLFPSCLFKVNTKDTTVSSLLTMNWPMNNQICGKPLRLSKNNDFV